MKFISVNGINLHYADHGDKSAPAVVFSNSLGTDYRLWDKIIDLLPSRLRVVRYDKRGHGLSSCPPYPYYMDNLVDDATALLDHLEIRDCLFVGLSIGGLIAQGLMLNRPELIRGAVLSNTGAKIGFKSMWEDRIKKARDNNLEEMAPAIIERWLSESFRNSQSEATLGWQTMLCRTPSEGYAGCSHAIMETDFSNLVPSVDKPVWAIAGSEDGATPPELVRNTADLIPGCEYYEIKDAAHLTCVEKPQEYVNILNGIIKSVFNVD